MESAAAEVLGTDDFTGRGLDQGWSAEEDRALLGDDDRLVGHRRDVGAAGGRGAEHRGEPRDAGGGERGLVVEDPSEVLAVGEDVVLVGQVRPAGVDEVDAREPVVLGDLLGTQVLLHRHRVVRAALDGGVVGDDDAFAAVHPADAGDDARSRARIVVHAVRGQRGELEERGARVEERFDAVAGRQLAAVDVLLPRLLRSPARGGRDAVPEFGDELGMRLGVRLPRRRIDGSSHCSHSHSPHCTFQLMDVN